MVRMLLPLLAGCSLTRIEHQACVNNAECNDQFGYGYVCDAEKFCAPVKEVPGCSVFPGDVGLPLGHGTTILYATMFETEQEAHAVRIAALDANDVGGVEGRHFSVLECVAPEAEMYDIAQVLSEDIGVEGIIGPASSDAVHSVFSAVRAEARTLVVTPQATSPRLTTLEGLPATDQSPGFLWRTVPSAGVQATVLASDLRKQRHRSVAVVVRNGGYGEGFAEALDAAFDGTLKTFTAGDLDAATTDAGAARTDAVVLATDQLDDVLDFLDVARTLPDYNNAAIYLPEVAADDRVVARSQRASALFNQVRGVRPADPKGPQFDAFSARYQEEWDQLPSPHEARHHDAAWMIQYGTAWSIAHGGLNAKGVAQGFRNLGAGDPIELTRDTWKDGRLHMLDDEPVDVIGASGPLEYDLGTEELVGPIEVWMWRKSGDRVTDYVTSTAR